MIQHAHPAKLTCDVLGVLIGWYLLWTRSLLPAVIVTFGASVLGTLLVWKHDVSQLYQTRLGRWMIGQANPINLLVRSTGFVVVCLGFWLHSVQYFLLGVVLIIAARLLGDQE